VGTAAFGCPVERSETRCRGSRKFEALPLRPGGESGNSPALQRWEKQSKREEVPQGRPRFLRNPQAAKLLANKI
jgi:hypothetical protein